jgi:hypothetical protein
VTITGSWTEATVTASASLVVHDVLAPTMPSVRDYDDTFILLDMRTVASATGYAMILPSSQVTPAMVSAATPQGIKQGMTVLLTSKHTGKTLK